jgi:hypothetical protein
MNSSSPDRETLQTALHHVLRQWHKPEMPDVETLTELRCYLRLLARPESSAADSLRQLIDQAVETFLKHDPASAHLLQQRFLENIGQKELSQRMAVSESQFYKLQQEALSRLTDILLEQEQQAQFEHRLAVEGRLEPLTHQPLFGVGHLQQHLHEVLVASGQPWLIALEGLGGIGKTSLADRLVRDLITSNRFFDLAWVSARQQTFRPAIGLTSVIPILAGAALTAEALGDALLTQLGQTQALLLPPQEKRAALTRLLKQRSYLVVIDNLETMADYQALLPNLRQLVNPTKFLLTSRHNLRAYADVRGFTVGELSQADAVVLLHHEAQVRQLSALVQANPAQLSHIYEVVGGNPLALKLVVGLLHALPLSQVLENLKQAAGRKITELYTYIYWQSWQTLSDVARQTLLTLPVASPRGSTSSHLAAVSGLTASELSQALEELIAFSLVEVGGDLEDRRYSIHRLTETFLMTEITQWPSSP